MCYHISLAAGAEELARRFGRKTDLVRKFRPAYHVCAFSHLPYPVVTRDEQIQYFRWGLIPYWIGKAAQTVTIRNQTVVACAETIFENASFRVPIRRRRCLIPVSGFFGWHHGQAQKTPLLRDGKGSACHRPCGRFRLLDRPRFGRGRNDVFGHNHRGESDDAPRQQQGLPDAGYPA